MQYYRAIHSALFFLVLLLLFVISIEFVSSLFPELIFLHPLFNKMCSLICHQERSKLIVIDPYSSLVCSRCFGIYAGALLTAFAGIFLPTKLKPSFKFLLIVFGFMLLDVLSYNMGIRNYSKLFALLSGLFFGCAAFLYISKGVVDFYSEIKRS